MHRCNIMILNNMSGAHRSPSYPTYLNHQLKVAR
nr:MAG TPA: hypothetical protein [Caudoviricetes sp.]